MVFMPEPVEDGRRPDTLNPCYVKCPYCNGYGDYWKTAYNTVEAEKNIITCLNCGKIIKVIGLGDACLMVADPQ
jgi:hypothetical protein